MAPKSKEKQVQEHLELVLGIFSAVGLAAVPINGALVISG